MNIAIVGSKNANKLADVLYKSFDGINVVGYNDVVEFRDSMVSRPLEVHRMILLEAAIVGDYISDNDIYDFQDMVIKHYPGMKLVTISTDTEQTKFLAALFDGQNYGHFCFPALKGKILVDIASMGIPDLYRKYKNYAYKNETKDNTEILDDNIFDGVENDSNDEINGYIKPPEVEDDRGFFGKLFGVHPTKAPKLVKNDGLTNIGQSNGGMDSFSQPPTGVDFNGPKEEIEDIFAEEDNDFTSMSTENEDEHFEFFGGSDNIDVGLGHFNEEPSLPVVNLEKEDLDFDDRPVVHLGKEDDTGIVYRKPKEDEPLLPFDATRLEKEEYNPNLDIDKEEVEEQLEEVEDIDIPSVDLSSLKKTVKNTDFVLSEDAYTQPNFIENINLDVEDADISAFEGDMSTLMGKYEEMHNQPKTIYVPTPVATGGSQFRNKNGMKIIIVSGDRRVGSTKLALNLANKYALIDNKVLFVDLDRNRHGSLGYLDLNNILEEPQHVQNGLNHLKNLNILRNVCHYYKKGKFFTLTSMYGEYIEDAQMVQIQNVLGAQKDYMTIVIDCPLENLYLLQTIIPFAKLLLCVEDDKVGVTNLLLSLDDIFDDDTLLYTFFEKSYFVVGRRGNINKFKEELADVVEMFELDETLCKWNSVEILGSIKEVDKLAERTGD